MDKRTGNDYFSILDNQQIGENIARHRKQREIDAAQIAAHIGVSEEIYLKYETGELDLSVQVIQKVGEMLKVDPLVLLSSRPGHFIGGIHHSPFGGIGNYVGGNFQMQDEQQTQLTMKLMENMLKLSERMIEVMGRER
ncbi:helix-turn-helix transcriptional regulator [Marinilabilia sp.]|uniref:helix-turn-helix domain-containing protein n=1 Tax=Marinilabilia sp. TaxID=2021252 RepID=UPI0025C58C46|nr:helix-turn-helix transcriptional regulator [Marinilabilia sp.]